MRRLVSILALFLHLVVYTYGQHLTTGLTPSARAFFPIGTWARQNLAPVGLGGGIEGLFGLTSLRYVTAGLDLGYIFIPVNANLSILSSDADLSLISLGLSVRGDLPMSERLTIYGRAHTSGFYGILSGDSDTSAPGFTWGAGGGLTFLFSNRLQLQAGATFESYPGFFNGVSVNIGLTTRLSGIGSTAIPREDFVPIHPGTLSGGGYIELLDARLDRVFPVLYKYYESHPIGSAKVVNKSRKTLENIEVRLILTEYMGTPMLSARIEKLGPGEERDIDIYALFTEDILSITEGAKLSSELKAEYRVDGSANSDTLTLTLNTFDRNSIKWDDDEKIAAFITARDEEILKYARNIASIVRDEGLKGFSSEFQLAIALLGAMDLTGCTYVVDPSSSYLELSKESAIDAVQFPRQTIRFRAGDCDDLTAAYTALLESVGVETGFITVPGHIYSAFKLIMSPAEAQRTFSRYGDLIIIDDQVWVPVETTALSKGFVGAWNLGARQWREYEANGDSELYPTREAWKTYEPVAFSVSNYELSVPKREDTVAVFVYELDQYVDQEISARERILLARLNRNPNDYSSRNSLGVLYARYGRMDEARDHFDKAAAAGYAPAFLNLGNLAYLGGDFNEARRLYRLAHDMSPENPTAVLGLARSAHALEEYDVAQSEYKRLAEISPPLAERYAYLAEESTGADRASEAVKLQDSVVWNEG